MKRFLSMLLALTMAVSCLPALGLSARAEDGYIPIEPVSMVYINPLYADVLDESDLVQPGAAVLAESDEYYTDAAQAAGYVREQLKARMQTIVVNLKVPSYEDSLISEIMEKAIAHTGVPTEGDYIRWQYGGWGAGMSGYSDYTNYYLTITYTVTYYVTAQQEQKMDAAVDALLAELGPDTSNNYKALKTVYDWMTANITYDYDNLDDSSYTLKHTAYAALINRTSVCQGYAVLLYRLLLELGIDNRVISGIGNGGGHAWNIVKLGSKYYNADATWDASWAQAGLDYEFFLRSNANFGDHHRDGEYETASFNSAYPMSDGDYVPGSEDDSHTHSYTKVTTAPTCTKRGYTTYTCSCGDSYVDDYTVAVDHSYVGGACVYCGAAEPGAGGSDEENWPFADWEWEVLKLTNKERYANGVEPLTGFALIQDAAGVRGLEITELFDHTRPNGTTCFTALDEQGVYYHSAGENIAAGQRSPAEVVDAWMNSPGHRANMLDSGFKHMGVGYEYVSYDLYHHYWVQMFTYRFGEEDVSFSLVCPNGTEFDAGTAIDDMGIYAVLENSTYGTCYLPIIAEYCSGYGANVTADQNVTVSALGYTGTFKVTRPGEAHVYGNWYTVTAPGCTETGEERRDCTHCDLYETREVAATGHSYGDWYVTEESTCGMYGEQRRDCAGCSEYETELLPLLEHDYTYKVTVFEPTCQDIGYTMYCCVCGDTYADDYVDPVDHCYENYVCVYCGTLEDNIIAVGSCGENLTWKLDDQGTLTISGEGAIDDYVEEEAPWCGYRDNIVSLVIEEGVTGIGYNAFYEYANLTEVTLPSTLSELSYLAFGECAKLEKIVFTGDAPDFTANVFSDTEATVYYPADNATWTADVMQNYGGYLTWVPYSPEDVIPGDANGDGNVDNIDAMLILQYAVGLHNGKGLNLDACDVDGNGSVDNVDAMMILQHAVGLLPVFPKA